MFYIRYRWAFKAVQFLLILFILCLKKTHSGKDLSWVLEWENFILSTRYETLLRFLRLWRYFSCPDTSPSVTWQYVKETSLDSCPAEMKEILLFLCPQDCHCRQNNMQNKPEKSSPTPSCLPTATIWTFSSVRLSFSIRWGEPYSPFRSILCPYSLQTQILLTVLVFNAQGQTQGGWREVWEPEISRNWGPRI